jgi:hypothetical protein
MAVKASDQISIVDVTDAYSVSMTSEAYTFVGDTTAALAGSCSTQITAMCGSENVLVTVGTITTPSGITAAISNNGSTAVTVTFTAAASTVKTACEATIPLTIDGDKEFTKKFSFGVALKGASGTSVTVKSQAVTYQAGTSGTTAPTGTWSSSIPSVTKGQFLWTKTVVTYSDGKSTTAYAVSYQPTNGTNGTSVTISSQSVTYQASTSGTTTPTGSWSTTIPTVANGSFLWTKTVVTYSDKTSTTSYSVSYTGKNGNNGADAITISITSSNGFIFKNADIVTVLTAHVYKAGKELDSTEIAALGTVKWYKDGSTTAAATGVTYSISAGDVSNKATFSAQLEG